MNKKGTNLGPIIAVAVFSVLLLGLVIWRLADKKVIDIKKYTVETSETGNYGENINKIIPANDDNGHIADHVEGNPDAEVLIFEYADYQCSGCATAFPRMKKLVEEYDGKVALVYRSFLLSYHQNGTAAASAAEAAGLQGYWQPYAEKLFANQSTWFYASGSERTDIFRDFFRTVSNGQGDEEQFVKDMNSEKVKEKVNFDIALAQSLDIPGTPSFYLNGERIDFSEAKTEEEFLNLMREKVDAELNK